MRTKLKCDAAGQVKVMDILTGINNNIDDIESLKGKDIFLEGEILKTKVDIADNATRIMVLEANKPADAGDLTDLAVRVTSVEADVMSIESSTGMITSNVATNTMELSALKMDVAQARSDLDTNVVDVMGMKTSVVDIKADTDSNTADVSDLGQRILAIEMGKPGGADSLLIMHQVKGKTGGGNAVAMTWTARPLGTAVKNTINATVGPTSVTLEKGDYIIRAIAIGEGANQSRLNFGSGMIYGTTLSSSGASEMQGEFSLAANTNISVETIVETSSGMDTFGKASPFTEDSVFLTMEIIKAG